MKTEDWQIDNHKQMNILRIVAVIGILVLIAMVGYNLFNEEPGWVKMIAIWVPLIFILIQMIFFNPEFISVAVKNGCFGITKRGLLHPRKKKNIVIPLSALKSSGLKKPNSLFRGRLIIEYEENQMTHTVEVPLNNFLLTKREDLVKRVADLKKLTGRL